MFISGSNTLSGCFQRSDIRIQDPGKIILVFYTDMLPHGRGGGSDAGQILKTSRCQTLHQFIFGIGISDQSDQACRNDMRKVADRAGHVVVGPVVKKNGQSFQTLDKLSVGLCFFL